MNSILTKINKVSESYKKRYGRAPNVIYLTEGQYAPLTREKDLALVRTCPLTLRERTDASVVYIVGCCKRMSARFDPDMDPGYAEKRVLDFGAGNMRIITK